MRDLTKKDYEKYISTVKQHIEETKRRMMDYERAIKVSQLSYEDWVKFQRGELKIKTNNDLSFFDKLIGAFKNRRS